MRGSSGSTSEATKPHNRPPTIMPLITRCRRRLYRAPTQVGTKVRSRFSLAFILRHRQALHKSEPSAAHHPCLETLSLKITANLSGPSRPNPQVEPRTPVRQHAELARVLQASSAVSPMHEPSRRKLEVRRTVKLEKRPQPIKEMTYEAGKTRRLHSNLTQTQKKCHTPMTIFLSWDTHAKIGTPRNFVSHVAF
jgi:hypothetical protein